MKAGKVWGVTEALLQNPVVEFHRIEVNKGGECSTHKHAHKWNGFFVEEGELEICLLCTSPSPRDGLLSRMPSSA